jgi:hypothetical protein
MYVCMHMSLCIHERFVMVVSVRSCVYVCMYIYICMRTCDACVDVVLHLYLSRFRPLCVCMPVYVCMFSY